MVFMAAFVAACAAFVACSSDDDLVQQKPEVPEESVEEGIPMTIKVADLASRGTDFSSTNPLQEFSLYSTMNSSWESGKLFDKDAGGNWTTNTTLTWPDDNTYTFYGISDLSHFSDLYDSEGNDGADTYKDVPVFVNKPASTEKTLKFSYAIPTDYAEQVDLLVSKNTGSSSSGDPKGSLTVDFNHALAQIKAIKVYCNIDKVSKAGDKVNYRFRIFGIRLGGLQTVGTYTFGDAFANDTWTVPTTDVDEDTFFEIPLKTSELTFAKGFQPTKKTTNSDDYTLTLPLESGEGLYLIPQVANGTISEPTSSSYVVNNAYAELDAQVYFYSDYVNDPDNGGGYRVGNNLWAGDGYSWSEATSDEVSYGKIRVPLKFTLVSGKGYTLIIDISNAVIYENEGSKTGFAVSESIFVGAEPQVG